MVVSMLAAALAVTAHAQTGGPYELSWSTIDGGTPNSVSGGTYGLDGTVGQPDAGRHSGGTYIMAGGFWNSGAVTVLGVGDPREPNDPGSLSLGAPNPFRSRTVFGFVLGRPQRIELRIFDLQGARVRTVLDEVVTAGRHTASWDGRDDRGRPVASGVYMVRIVGAEVSGSGKVVLLRN